MSTTTTSFKKCGPCGFEWTTLNAFLGDPNIEIIGYQAHFEELKLGLLLFNHSCRGTLSIRVNLLRHLYDGPIFEERMTGGEKCHGYCSYEGRLDMCPNQCECAYIREIIQRIKNWTKN